MPGVSLHGGRAIVVGVYPQTAQRWFGEAGAGLCAVEPLAGKALLRPTEVRVEAAADVIETEYGAIERCFNDAPVTLFAPFPTLTPMAACTGPEHEPRDAGSRVASHVATAVGRAGRQEARSTAGAAMAAVRVGAVAARARAPEWRLG